MLKAGLALFKQSYAESKIIFQGAMNVWAKRQELSQMPLKVLASKSLDSYRNHIETKTPMMTTILSITGTYILGQGLAQVLTQNYDLSMLGTYALYGPLGGLSFYLWFGVLDKIPGMMLIKSNFYQNLFFEQFPKKLKDHVKVSLNRDIFITDLQVKGNVHTSSGEIIPEGTKFPGSVASGTQLPMTALTFYPEQITKVNKWSLKFTKILADQLIFSSTYTLFLISCVGLLSGHDLVTIAGTIQHSFWPIFKIDCMVWPILQFINFTYIPRSMQPIAVNGANIFWNAFICVMLGGH